MMYWYQTNCPVGPLLLAGERERADARALPVGGAIRAAPAPDWHCSAAPFADAVRRARGVLRRRAAQLLPATRTTRHALPAERSGRRCRLFPMARRISYGELARRLDPSAPRGARRGSGQRRQPAADHRSLPPRHRRRRLADGIRRWPADQARVAAARGSSVRRRSVRLRAGARPGCIRYGAPRRSHLARKAHETKPAERVRVVVAARGRRPGGARRRRPPARSYSSTIPAGASRCPSATRYAPATRCTWPVTSASIRKRASRCRPQAEARLVMEAVKRAWRRGGLADGRSGLGDGVLHGPAPVRRLQCRLPPAIFTGIIRHAPSSASRTWCAARTSR